MFTPTAKYNIVLFDGICNLCNHVVDFLIDRDSKKRFRFASLQSDIGQKIVKKFNLSTIEFNTIILVEGEKCYTKSTAVLRIAKMLKAPWQILFGFIIIPRFFRDVLYDIISKRRYKWFGKMDKCSIPTEELRDRFLS